MGLGVWVGVRVTMALYHSKFENGTALVIHDFGEKGSVSMLTSVDIVKQPRPVHSRRILLAVALGAVMWAVAIFWGSHSEGFHFLEGKDSNVSGDSEPRGDCAEGQVAGVWSVSREVRRFGQMGLDDC
jgi:hypothetical protein